MTVDGEEYDIESIEAFADGRFFIFLEDRIDGDESEVIVTFNNPTDPAFQLIYASGENKGKPVANYDDTADYDEDMDDVYAYTYQNPVMISADPEPGSFNLPNSIKEFKVTFDKNVNCEKLVATINNQPMTVTPATGHATEITLTRTSEGDLPTGAYSIHLTKVFPEVITSEKDFTDTTYVVNVGKVELGPDDVEELIMTDDFANGGSNWMVKSGNNWQAASSGSGCRIITNGANSGQGFTPSILYLGSREDGVLGEALYQSMTLRANRTYHLTFGAARWDGGSAERKVKVQVLPADAVDFDYTILNEDAVVAEEAKAIIPEYKTTDKATEFDVAFQVAEAGEYVLRFITSNTSDGAATWNDASAIGKVKVEYIPETAGVVETKALQNALENARTVRENNSNERYAGEAYDALDAAIQKYETEGPGYTAPSKYTEAVKVLETTSEALKAHVALCNSYDEQIKKGIDIVRQNELPNGQPNPTKFVVMKEFGQLKETVDKYHGTSEWRNVADTIADPEAAAQWQLFYSYDVLMEDAALQPAIDELTGITNTATLLFTEGVSAPENANSGKGTGVAVFVDRLRLGADALVNLIAPDKKDSAAVAAAEALPDVVAARNALIDSDPIAEKLQLLLKQQLFTRITTPGDPVFDVVTDTLTGDDNYQSYDMSVFVKAPNIYKQEAHMNFTAENVPGWTTPEGFNAPGLTGGWGGDKSPGANEPMAVDVMFQTWGGSYRVEQTVTDLPAGIYTVKLAFGERDNGNVNSHMENSFAYARTSETVLPDAGESDIDAELRDLYFAAWGEGKGIGQSFPFCSDDSKTVTLTNIPVADGILTIGVNAADGSHTFFNEVRLYINLPYEGFDYASELATVNEMIESGIESKTVAPAKVRALELYDLNGRRIVSASRGIAIVKKYMSDGTVRIEKVIKK